VERRFSDVVNSRALSLGFHLESVGGPASGGGMTYSELLLSAGPLKPAAKKKAAQAKSKFEKKQQEGSNRPRRWGTGISSDSSSPMPKPKRTPKSAETESDQCRGRGRVKTTLEEHATNEFLALCAATNDIFSDQFITGAHRRITRHITAGQKDLAKATCGAALLLCFIGRGWDGRYAHFMIHDVFSDSHVCRCVW